MVHPTTTQTSPAAGVGIMPSLLEGTKEFYLYVCPEFNGARVTPGQNIFTFTLQQWVRVGKADGTYDYVGGDPMTFCDGFKLYVLEASKCPNGIVVTAATPSPDDGTVTGFSVWIKEKT